MHASTRVRRLIFAVLIVALLIPMMVMPAAAHGHLPPVPITGPRDPQPIPLDDDDAHDPFFIYNWLVGNLPASSAEADASIYEEDGEPGVLDYENDLAVGLHLKEEAGTLCANFDEEDNWVSMWDDNPPSDVWSDWWGGWGPFAVDDGYYSSKWVTFTAERSIGPGSNAWDEDDEPFAAKIASTQPYAAGFASPVFIVEPGAEVTVRVKYLIYNHGDPDDDRNWNYDWASLGVKADAYSDDARYVNGYVRGKWAELVNTVTAGPDGKIMVMIQGHSPAALNSNIYFDHIQIWVNGKSATNCK